MRKMRKSMSKRWGLLLAVCLLALLCGCAQGKTEPTAGTVAYNGTDYVVTPDEGDGGTISDGTYTYRYAYTTTGSGYRVTFEYPDGEQYTWTQNGSVGTGSGTSLHSGKYPDGTTLLAVLEKQLPAKKAEKNGVLIVLLLLLGAVNTAWPKGAWYLETGWKLRDAEPSEAALLVNRLLGVALLVAALICLLV